MPAHSNHILPIPVKIRFVLPLLSISTSICALAAPQTFDFKDPKGVNHAKFTLDAPLETISGTANGVSGTLTIDPSKPEATTGTITVDAKTLHVENAMMKEHMLGAEWMDAAKNPNITFTVKSLEDFKMDGTKANATVVGTFSIKGVEKEISVPATVTLLPGKLGDRTGGKMQGDLAVIRTTFKIKCSDYNINPKAPTDKVSDEIEVSLAIAGASPSK
jgi:polyisoprenoid-binding protein YceI